MGRLTLVVPGSLETRTGGYIYNRRIADGLRRRGWQVEVVPPAEDALSSVPDGGLALIDSLALGTMAEAIAREHDRIPIVALMHMPTGGAAERLALRHAAAAIATGRPTGEALVPHARRVYTIHPGTDRRVVEPRPLHPPRAVLELLCVATLTGPKGHDVLLRALSRRRDVEWRLTCAGSIERDPEGAAMVRATIAALDLTSRVSLAGDLDAVALDAAYRAADVFVLATRRETYGMAVAEAIAYGLPVISTTAGEIASIVGDGGLLAVPGDEPGFSDILDRVLFDASLRHALAARARVAAATLPTWDEANDRMAIVLEEIAARG